MLPRGATGTLQHFSTLNGGAGGQWRDLRCFEWFYQEEICPYLPTLNGGEGGNECQRRIKIYQNYAFCARPYGHMAKSYLKRNGNFTFPSIFALPEITFSLTQPHMRGLGRTRSQQHYFSF